MEIIALLTSVGAPRECIRTSESVHDAYLLRQQLRQSEAQDVRVAIPVGKLEQRGKLMQTSMFEAHSAVHCA
jgi:hypothetical protein